MAIYQTPQAVLDRVQQVLRASMQHNESTIANVEQATTEHDRGMLWFRKRPFLVPPVSFRMGLWLLALDQELRRLATLDATYENIKKTMDVLETILNIFHSLVRPYRLTDRLLWKILPNPFKKAEMGEINALRSFFCTALTKYPVEAVSSIRAPSFLRQTWGLPKPDLQIGIHAG